jgi:hypothetical protein
VCCLSHIKHHGHAKARTVHVWCCLVLFRSFPRSFKPLSHYPFEFIAFCVLTIRSLQRFIFWFIFEPAPLQGLPRLRLAKMQRFIFRCVFRRVFCLTKLQALLCGCFVFFNCRVFVAFSVAFLSCELCCELWRLVVYTSLNALGLTLSWCELCTGDARKYMQVHCICAEVFIGQ